VTLFLQQRLRKVSGTSISHMELRAAYEAWCAERGHAPLSVPKFAAELKALGCHNKWKSCGVVRYGDLQLVA